MGKLKRLSGSLTFAKPKVGYVNRAEAQRGRDRLRAQGSSLRGLYNTKRWRDPATGVKIRILVRDGWMCQGCETPHQLDQWPAPKGKTPGPNSPVIDHKTPHRGNLALFWDEDNLQAVCKAWHDSTKQKLEKSGPLAAAAGRGGSDP